MDRPSGGPVVEAAPASPLLQRPIQDKLLNPLAQRLLAGDFKPGDTVKVGAGRGEDLEFVKG